jgi:hypothetical protein
MRRLICLAFGLALLIAGLWVLGGHFLYADIWRARVFLAGFALTFGAAALLKTAIRGV